MTSGLTVTRIDQRGQLAELEGEWDALLAQTDVASPFLTPGWQLAWLDTYGATHRPFVLAARRSGELIGLWPFALRWRGPFRVLEPMGAGRSDWLDVPVRNDQREAVLAAFLEYLLEHRCAWDLIDHRDVLAESPTIRILKSLCDDGPIRLRREPRTVAPYLKLSGTWEKFLGSKRPKFRSNLKYYRRLPERNGQRLTIRRLQWGTADEGVDHLAAIELRSWKALEGNLKISTPIGREFYRRFCRYLAGRGWLEVWIADIGDIPIAFILNIIYQGKCYHYNTCYDEEFGNISPGMLLHADAISDAFERKLSEYDFLSGDEPYKDRWSTNRREIEHVALFSTRPASVAAFSTLVSARWAFRKSERLRKERDRIIFAARRFIRGRRRQ